MVLPAFFVDLRLIYAELINPNVHAPVFVDAVWDAIEGKQLYERDVAAAAKSRLKFCRGREAAAPLVQHQHHGGHPPHSEARIATMGHSGQLLHQG